MAKTLIVTCTLFTYSIILCGCARHEITATEARTLAWQRIKENQRSDHIDAKQLPPLHMEKRKDSYYFWVDDPKQNASVTAYVLKDGEVVESVVALSRMRAVESGKNVMLVAPGVTVPAAASIANAKASATGSRP